MADSLRVTEQVRGVAQMGRPQLVSEWQAQFGAPPPPKLRVELMRPVLVYRIQENASGTSAPRQKGPRSWTSCFRCESSPLQDRHKDHP